MSSVYLISELGQNMQGSVELGRDMIYRLANPMNPQSGGTPKPDEWTPDAVKTQKRDLSGGELSRQAERKEYTAPKSFAHETGEYQEHRERLELSWPEQKELHDYAKQYGLDFIITLCADTLVEPMYEYFTPDALKVASRDLTNTRLLRALADTGLPIILSTGMATREDIERAVGLIERRGGHLQAILQCTSSYPCDFDDLHLNGMRWIQDRWAGYEVGLSDHSQGVQAGAWATVLGADMVEFHVTASRALRGGDHMASLDIAGGTWRYCRNVRNAERAMGEYGMVVPDSVESAREKLERSVAFADDLGEGTVLESSHLVPLSPGTGVEWPEHDQFLGRELVEDVEGQTLASSTMID